MRKSVLTLALCGALAGGQVAAEGEGVARISKSAVAEHATVSSQSAEATSAQLVMVMLLVLMAIAVAGRSGGGHMYILR